MKIVSPGLVKAFYEYFKFLMNKAKLFIFIEDVLISKRGFYSFQSNNLSKYKTFDINSLDLSLEFEYGITY